MTTAKSIPATETAPNATHSAAGEEPAKVADAIAEPADAVAPAKKSLAFPLTLTVFAVFPIALGVGAARLKASSAPQVSVCIENAEPDVRETILSTSVTDRRLGDREFQARRYEVALQYYQSLGTENSARLPADLLYRIALCQEGLGRWNDALENMRTVSNTTESSVLKSAAIFAQGRIHFRLNDPKQAVPLLRMLQLRSHDNDVLPGNLSREIAFLVPLGLANDCLTQGGRDHRISTAPISELLNWSLDAALDWVGTEPVTDDSAADAINPVNILTCKLDPHASTKKPVSSIETINVGIHCQGQSIKSLIQALADECQWELNWTDLAHDSAIDRNVDYKSEDQPLSLVLTMVCSDLRANWSLDGSQLVIQRADPDGSRARKMISRTLNSLVSWIPNYRHCSHARYAMGELAEADGRKSDALQIYTSLVGRESSPVAIRAAYNAAMIYYHSADYSRACFQLGYVVNGAPGHELHKTSLLLLGQLLLDSGEPQEAIFQFRRATEPSNGQDVQARAAVGLGLAYLIQNRYQEAAEVILTYKFRIEEPEIRNIAAFVNSFARWQATSGEVQEREATFLYRSLVSVKPTSEHLGQAGQMLLGRAYADLGFEDLMVDLYTRMLSSNVTPAIEMELKFSLANHDLASGRADAAMESWRRLAAGSSVVWANRARQRMAELSIRQGRAEDALHHCDFINTDEGIVRADIYKLRGRAYELLGEDELAARSYAGQIDNQ